MHVVVEKRPLGTHRNVLNVPTSLPPLLLLPPSPPPPHPPTHPQRDRQLFMCQAHNTTRQKERRTDEVICIVKDGSVTRARQLDPLKNSAPTRKLKRLLTQSTTTAGRNILSHLQSVRNQRIMFRELHSTESQAHACREFVLMVTFLVGSGEVDAVQCRVVHLTRRLETVGLTQLVENLLKGAGTFRRGIRVRAAAASREHAWGRWPMAMA